MNLTDRDLQALKDIIDRNHQSMMDNLKMRTDYWDERIDKICSTIMEMKTHCTRQQDNCSIMFKEIDKRVDDNSSDITKIKTTGSILMILWGAIITIATQVLRIFK